MVAINLASQRMGQLRETMKHEMVHVLLHRATEGIRVPRWFDEGLAMWLSGEWRIGQSLDMVYAVLTDTVIPLSEVDYMLDFRSYKARRAYLESFLAITYLMKLGGPVASADVLEKLRRGSTFDQALLEVLGYTEKGFERKWEEYVRDRFSLLSLLIDSSSLWIAMCMLFLLAYGFKKMRARRILKTWEQEETDDLHLEVYSEWNEPSVDTEDSEDF